MNNNYTEANPSKSSTSVEQFEALFNHATIGIVMTNGEGKIINFNKEAENQFKYTKEEVIHQQIEILVPKQLRKTHHHHCQSFYNNPTSRQMGKGRELYAQKKDGTTFPVEISLTHHVIGSQTFIIAFVIDITVRKQNEDIVLQQKKELEKITTEIKQLNTELEQKIEDRTKMLKETLLALEKSKEDLERSKEELSIALKDEKKLSELKSRFVTMASHEFRTPLSTILSSTFLLEKYNNTEAQDKRSKHIHYIRDAVENMKTILEDFLSLGRLEEGLVKASMKTLTAPACFKIIEDVMHEMEHSLKPGQNINLIKAGSLSVQADQQLLKNILINLISNASKFSPEHSTIHIESEIKSDNLRISVRDHGVGISEEDQEHLFERFFRAKNAANIQGTGLGLHIIAKYLELMNGKIELHSKLNEGTCITIHIKQPFQEN